MKILLSGRKARLYKSYSVLVFSLVFVLTLATLILIPTYHTLYRGLACISFNALVILAGLVLIFLRYVPKNTLYIRDLQVYHHFPEEAVIPDSEHRVLLKMGFTAVSCEMEVACYTSSVQPITQNPKVREIVYGIYISASEGVEALLKRRRLEKEVSFLYGNLEMWKRSLLYRFNDAKSADLAELFDPMNSKQQESFARLAYQFLDPFLADSGFHIGRVHFDLAQPVQQTDFLKMTH